MKLTVSIHYQTFTNHEVEGSTVEECLTQAKEEGLRNLKQTSFKTLMEILHNMEIPDEGWCSFEEI